MAFDTVSDPYIRFALWTGLLSLLLAALLILYVLLLRWHLHIEASRSSSFIAQWRPVLAGSLLGAAVPPRLPRSRLKDFLLLWNHMHESIRGPAVDGLDQLLQALDLSVRLRSYLQGGSFRLRLLAIMALGHLRDQAAWPTLRHLSTAAEPVLSLCAARALVQIDPAASVRLLLGWASERPDWPPARVGTILLECGPDQISQPLAEAILGLPPEQATRLLPYCDLAHAGLIGPALAELMQRGHDDQVVSACLKVMQDPYVLPIIRIQLSHPRWHVRAQAARALGRLGSHGDELRLTPLLADPQWWVRYRAAQAIASLPFMSPVMMMEMRDAQTDRFARDILVQVMAEGGGV